MERLVTRRICYFALLLVTIATTSLGWWVGVLSTREPLWTALFGAWCTALVIFSREAAIDLERLARRGPTMRQTLLAIGDALHVVNYISCCISLEVREWIAVAISIPGGFLLKIANRIAPDPDEWISVSGAYPEIPQPSRNREEVWPSMTK
jgi:hypothetical protein